MVPDSLTLISDGHHEPCVYNKKQYLNSITLLFKNQPEKKHLQFSLLSSSHPGVRVRYIVLTLHAFRLHWRSYTRTAVTQNVLQFSIGSAQVLPVHYAARIANYF